MFIINGVRWRIEYVRPDHPMLRRDDGSYTLGVCDNNSKMIYITEGLSLRKLWHVLAHEVTHAAMFSYSIVLNPFQQELIADLVATYGDEIISITNEIFSKLFYI